MANGVDIAISLATTINVVMKKLAMPSVPIVVCTDSLSLYECLVKGTLEIHGNVLHWSSTKCKRVTRSVLASEIYAMAHGVDIAISIATTMNTTMKRLAMPSIPIVVCTDSLSLYECLVKLGTTKEKRLMIDIMALREAYERGDVSDIRWIDGRDNPADAMTKASPNAALSNLIDTNNLTMRVQGWVSRTKTA